MDTSDNSINQLPGFEDVDDDAVALRWRARPEPESKPPGPMTGVTGTNRRLYTISEAAELLGIGRSTAYELARTGEIDVVQIGGRRLITPTVLEGLLGERPPLPADLHRAQ